MQGAVHFEHGRLTTGAGGWLLLALTAFQDAEGRSAPAVLPSRSLMAEWGGGAGGHKQDLSSC